MKHKIISCFILLLFSSVGFSQDKTDVKFGNVRPKDFETKIYSIDTGASAVVIGDFGNSYFEGNEDGWFTFYHKRYRRVHLLNKNGYDMASIEIHLYVDGNIEEELQKFQLT